MLKEYDLSVTVPNRTAAVEAMNAKKVDLVLTGPAEYVVFRKRTGAVPVLGFSRPDYFATIVVLADSGLGRIADLRGKKVALGPVGSTSKHRPRCRSSRTTASRRGPTSRSCIPASSSDGRP
ncbi:MAG: PhnD/SsuA/transferrin family substrate-binding protein [Gammaproteobacteria bacterium]